MIFIQLIFAFIIIFLAGGLLLNSKLFGAAREPAEIKMPLYFFAGTGVISFYMFALSLLNIRFSVLLISLPFILYFLANIRLISSFKLPSFKRPDIRLSIALISFAVLALVCAAMLFDGLVSPIFSKDAFAMWFMKAKMIFLERRIPFEILKQPFYAYSSPEYPQLVPLNLAWISICLSQWNDILLRMFFIVQYILFIPFLYESLKRYTSRNMAALGCLLLLANNHVLGYAANGYVDLMLGMFTAVSAVYLIRWMEEQDRSHLLMSAFFIGCAAFTKDDGIALFAAMSVSLALFLALSRRKIGTGAALSGFFMFIAAAGIVFVPYQAVSSAYHISSHMIKDANIIAATAANIGRAPHIAGHFLYQLYLNTYSWQYFWIFITIFLIAGRRKISGTNMKYIFIFLMISLALYFEVYMLTAANNLTSSFHRLLIGLAPTAVFLAFSAAPRDDGQR
jgi:hypothetical protein